MYQFDKQITTNILFQIKWFNVSIGWSTLNIQLLINNHSIKRQINQLNIGLEQYFDKYRDCINKITRTCVINDEVSSSTLVDDFASHD